MRPSFKCSYLASAAMAVMLAGCSSSMDRLMGRNSDPTSSDPVYTASVPKDRAATADEGDGVTSRPLAKAPVKRNATYADSGYDYKPAYRQPGYRKPSQSEVAQDQIYKQPSYREQAAEETAPITKPRYRTRTAETAPAAMPGKSGRVTVESGMTLYSIARANGLTVSQLAAANGIRAPYSVAVGQTLRIPGRAVAQAPEPTFKPRAQEFGKPEPAMAPAPRRIAAGGMHKVAPGETLFALGRKYGVKPYAIADLNKLSHTASLSVGQDVRIPGGAGKAVAQSLAEEEAAPAAETPPAASADASEAQPTLSLKGQDRIAEQAAPDPSLPGFRWPVKGKVISGFGPKNTGGRNEGINIAVPAGTSVRAAGPGVVAYAGSELKGYGNLVLIRHEGGWVTAYAHANELFVKRGDTVKRGDVIAKAGDTGSVTSPQLHFEIRKGATAMDPIRYLGSATASN